jgi:hypothetical protein
VLLISPLPVFMALLNNLSRALHFLQIQLGYLLLCGRNDLIFVALGHHQYLQLIVESNSIIRITSVVKHITKRHFIASPHLSPNVLHLNQE